MDSRLIFISSKTFQSKIEWEQTKYPDSEWSAIKSDILSAKEQVYQIIVNFFDSDILHVSIGRKNSFTTNKNQILSQIETLINQSNFYIWNERFTSTIEFNKIGVLRCGQVSRQQKATK
ncbi:MAG: hypothetical protein IPP15_06540 [Saprospiraceae bacterium]|uniref:Uncharacterized protein n=1 Tax=Candidatus Opimibacter skivensis TaxID=2982028 RepID=A0A9D7XNC5_9BACT|nr:hypothetical protein [Candidatus Opimibacter skivensis]